MAFGVKVKVTPEVDSSKLRQQIQIAIENATQGKPVKIRHLDVQLGRQEASRVAKQLESAIASQDLKVKISSIDATDAIGKLKNKIQTELSNLSFGELKAITDLAVNAGSINVGAIRSEIQKAVDSATKSSAVKIRNLEVSFGAQDASKAAKAIEESLSGKNVNVDIKIRKIDASEAVNRLKGQLEAMMAGLSITGLREFVGDTASESALNKAADAAERLAKAQENVKKRTQEANSNIKVLSTVSQSLSKAGNAALQITDMDVAGDYLKEYMDLTREVERIKSLEGDAQAEATAGIMKSVQALHAKISAYKEAEAAAKRQRKAEEDSNATEAQSSALAKRAVTLRQKINTWIDNNSKAYRQYKAEIDGMRASLQNEGSITKEQLGDLDLRFTKIAASAKASGIAGKTFLDKLKDGWERFSGVSLVSKIMMSGYNTVYKMIGAVRELDAAMTELKKVTDLTDQAYTNFISEAADIAKSVGTSLSDTISAVSEFSRLGYDISDASELASAALVYKNVGDGIESVTVATESLISTMKAFGIEASDSMGIVDKFNAVGRVNCPISW